MAVRLVVVVYLMRSTRRVLSLLRTYAANALKSADLANVQAIKLSVQGQIVLIRRLAGCAKLVAAASLALMPVACCMALRIGYYQPNPVSTLLLDSVFIMTRLLACLAAVLFCRPPPDRRALEKLAAHTSFGLGPVHSTASKRGAHVVPAPTSRSQGPAAATQLATQSATRSFATGSAVASTTTNN
jgi:hypothetical protein